MNHFYLDIKAEHISTSENELAKRKLRHFKELGIQLSVLAIFNRGYPLVKFIDFLEMEGIHYLIHLSSKDYKGERKQMQTADGNVILKHSPAHLQKIRKNIRSVMDIGKRKGKRW